MHLSIPFALPTTNDTMSLEKRSHHGWIGSFDENSCTSQPIGDRPKVTWFDCIKFKPAAYGNNKYVGINYGTGVYHFNSLTFYSDDACKGVTDGIQATTVQPGNQGLACQVTPNLGHTIGSVMIKN